MSNMEIDISSELKNNEIKAKEEAKSMIINYLKSQEQLEKTDELRKYINRQKGSVEAKLKSAFQLQLDGVKTGLSQLNSALKDIQDIKKNLNEIETSSNLVQNMQTKLARLCQESWRHSDLMAACDNVLHIFTVTETMKKCRIHLSEGKLLHAHKCISEMERSRDEILYELYKQPIPSPTDRMMIMEHFDGLDELVEELSKQIKVNCQRALGSIRLEAVVVVNTVRIIEREENFDKLVARKYQGLQLPGRPRKWKEMMFDTFKKYVSCKIECCQMEERSNNKMWLVRHLEVIRQFVLEDLKVVKCMFEPCFPPHYDIINHFILFFHETISQHLNDIIDQGFEGNELFSLLNWVNDYPTSELMGHKDLKIDVSNFSPLITQQRINQLHSQYILSLRSKLKEWMVNAIKTDSKDWVKDQEPEKDDKNFYSTSLPVLLIQMIEQHIDVSKTINQDLVLSLVNMSIDEMKEFLDLYKGELSVYEALHSADRSQPKYYIQYLIANANNCDVFAHFILSLKSRYPSVVTEEKIKPHFSSSDRLLELLCTYMIKEIFADLEPHIQDLMTKKWTMGQESIDTICMTVEDYHQDLVHLKKPTGKKLLEKVRLRLIKDFYKNLLAKKIMFKSYEERLPASEKIIKEAEKLRDLFRKLLAEDFDPKTEEGQFEAIKLLAELVRLKDTSMLSLEISGLATRYPDIRTEMLLNILTMRGDMSRSDAKQVVVDALGEDHDFKVLRAKKTIFSYLDDKHNFH